jgi:putative acetyltransferase
MLSKSGGSYFFDEVLEYRVWVRPGGNDYYKAFVNYEDALKFSQKTKGVEAPLVLICQYEWIDEPNPGEFIHKKGERVTEWLPEWLEDSARKEGDIEEYIASNSTGK